MSKTGLHKDNSLENKALIELNCENLRACYNTIWRPPYKNPFSYSNCTMVSLSLSILCLCGYPLCSILYQNWDMGIGFFHNILH